MLVVLTMAGRLHLSKYLITVEEEAFDWTVVLSLEQRGTIVYNKNCGVGLAFVALEVLKRDLQEWKDRSVVQM